MLIDGGLVPDQATLRADVVIVGAGPAGITVATDLAARGHHVLLLEAAGRHHGRADDDALDGDGSGRPFPLVRSRHRGFGGTSTHWTPANGLRVRRLDECDFARSACRPQDSWPFGAQQLERFYRAAYVALGLDPDDRPERWYGDTSPTALAWSGGPQLGMFQFADHDCFTRRFDEVSRNPRIELVLHASVERLELDRDDHSVARVVVHSGRGAYFAAAQQIVLACGAIENARVLLASPGPNGCAVGNEYDNVGRYFMDHVSVDSGVLTGEPSKIVPEIFREQSVAGSRFQPMLWLGDERITEFGLPNAAFWIDRSDRAYGSSGVSALRSLRAALDGRPRGAVARHGAAAIAGSPGLVMYAGRKFLRSESSREVNVRILAEQVPSRESRVRLSTRRDALDRQRVDIDWKVAGADLDGIDAHHQLLTRLLGVDRVATFGVRYERGADRPPLMSNYHHLGTTRMHVDPRHGVVDADGRLHSAANVFVTGGSVFPTGGYVNPTLTIIALALRTAETIDHQRRSTGNRSRRTPSDLGRHDGKLRSRAAQLAPDAS